jgi:ABC-type multidrug transport system fused ATPase/permease subunit
MIRYLPKFLYVLADKKKGLPLLIFLFLFTSILDAFGIGLVGPFIGLATSPESTFQTPWLNWVYTQSGAQSTGQFIALLGLIIIGVFYIKSFLYFRVQKYIYSFSFAQQADLRTRLLHAYLTVPYSFHLSRNSAVLIQNILNETHRLCQGFMIPLLNASSNFVVLLILLLLLIKTDAMATLIVLGILLLAFVPYYQSRNKISNWGMEVSKTSDEIIRVVNHSLGGLKETRVIGCEAYFEAQMIRQAERCSKVMESFATFQILPRIAIETLLITFLVGLCSIFLLKQTTTQNLASVLGVFSMASIRLMPAINQMVASTSAIRNSSFTLDKLYHDLKELEHQGIDKHWRSLHSSKVGYLSGLKDSESHVMPLTEQIILDNVTYRYPGTSDLALKEVSLVLKKGQSIGLIGKSGAGKTTLVDVILGLLLPESGDIIVDGKSIYANLRSWQNLIGYIPQTIFLMDETVEKNVAFGVPQHLIDRKRLSEAIQAAQLTELVEQLPDGLQTVIGERGIRLSGGQRQRIGIARALYHEREILVLDEATAALDNETESLVNESIKSLNGIKTMIIIAHRLSTVEHCDCIYMMDKGHIIKSGNYQEVVLGDLIESN